MATVTVTQTCVSAMALHRCQDNPTLGLPASAIQTTATAQAPGYGLNAHDLMGGGGEALTSASRVLAAASKHGTAPPSKHPYISKHNSPPFGFRVPSFCDGVPSLMDT